MAQPLFDGVRRKNVRHMAVHADDVAGVEDELRRLIARELHDRVAQTLTGMLVDVENFKAEEVGWSDVVRQMDKVQGSTRLVLQNLRQLLHDLRGEEATEVGFVDAVRDLAARFTEQTQISAEVNASPRWPKALGRPAYLNLYRIVEEALANVRMHSGASGVAIRLEPYSESEISLVVQDDGRGVDTDGSRPMGLGTVGMKERAVLLGGKLTIVSQPGVGTIVRAQFPTVLLIPKDVSQSTDLLLSSEVPA